MASIPPRMCPRCRRLTVGRCLHCYRLRDLERPSAIARGYGREWSAYSAEWLRQYPYCGQRSDGALHVEHSRCAQQGKRIKAEVTDHILPIRAGGARFEPSNHQSLCRACNAAKDASRGPRALA